MYQPLQKITPAYLFKELYRGDPYITPFFNAYNLAAQYYLDWYNENPTAVYTDSNISGNFLNFVALGLYNLRRPVLSDTNFIEGENAMNSLQINAQSMNYNANVRAGSGAVIVNDDIFKRVLTWHLYLNDGKQATMPWLRKRIARFIYGIAGTDITNDVLQYVNISFPSKGNIEISLNDDIISEQFKLLLEQGWLSLPFQVNFSVVLI